MQVTGKLDGKLGGPVTAFKGTLPFITKHFETDLAVFGSYALDVATYHSVRGHSTIFDNRYGLSFHRTSADLVEKIKSADLILIHGFYLASTLRVLRLASPSTHIFIMPHGSLEEFQEKSNQFMKYIFKKLFKKITSKKDILFITATGKEAVNLSRVFPTNRIEIVGMGVPDVETINLSETRSNVIVMVGRIHPVKRIDIAIEAFKGIAQDYPDLELLIIGSGNRYLTNKLQLLVRNYGLNKRITFIPYLVNSKVRFEISKAKILINCSDNENFSIACAEATCEGTPVLTSQKTGFSEFIDLHKSGIVTRDNDPALLEHGMRELLANWQFFHEKCLQNSKLLAWDSVANQWLKVLTQER
jgi:glycosyltransferase involved in cell wall biosynthesis